MTLDTRTWFKGQHEFSSIITVITVSACELDLLELGSRVGAAYCKEFSTRVEEFSVSHVRLLHPTEWKKGVNA